MTHSDYFMILGAIFMAHDLPSGFRSAFGAVATFIGVIFAIGMYSS